MSKPLSEAISFSAGGTSALMSAISGLDDFELICFLVIK
jgi:helicase domain/SNF2 family domain protein